MDHAISPPHRRLGLLAGPILIGLCAGIPYGIQGILLGAGYFPALVFGLALVMLPALYIGSALLGDAPAARQVSNAMLEALGDLGVVLAGLSPALAFLLATSSADLVPVLLSMAVVCLAALLGLRALYVRLLAGRPARLSISAFFGVWALTALGIGLHFFLRMLDTLKGAL